jgi:hypothetical protein
VVSIPCHRDVVQREPSLSCPSVMPCHCHSVERCGELPQGRTVVRVLGAPHRPIARAPLLRLTGPPPDAESVKREIAELEERLLALRMKLAAIEGPRRTAKPRSGRAGRPRMFTRQGDRPPSG